MKYILFVLGSSIPLPSVLKPIRNLKQSIEQICQFLRHSFNFSVLILFFSPKFPISFEFCKSLLNNIVRTLHDKWNSREFFLCIYCWRWKRKTEMFEINTNGMHTCMVVRPVPSANSRFSLGDGYALCAYHSRRIERDFSWNEWNKRKEKRFFSVKISDWKLKFNMFSIGSRWKNRLLLLYGTVNFQVKRLSSPPKRSKLVWLVQEFYSIIVRLLTLW